MDPRSIREMLDGEAAHCERILRSLPAWFGIEEALVQYVEDAVRLDTLVAESDGDGIVGFVTIRRHNPASAEVHAIAVAPEWHGRGLGRALMQAAESRVRADGAEYLQVKTLGPSRPDRNYERTRGFYDHLGYRPLEENNLWGDVNPCMIFVKHLACSG